MNEKGSRHRSLSDQPQPVAETVAPLAAIHLERFAHDRDQELRANVELACDLRDRESPYYRDAIEQYFRRLASEGSDK